MNDDTKSVYEAHFDSNGTMLPQSMRKLAIPSKSSSEDVSTNEKIREFLKKNPVRLSAPVPLQTSSKTPDVASKSDPSAKPDTPNNCTSIPEQELIDLYLSESGSGGLGKMRHKRFVGTVAAQATTSAANTVPLSIAQYIQVGNEYYNRLGSSIKIRKVIIKVNIAWASTSAVAATNITPDAVRIVCVQDRMPLLTTIWADDGSLSANTSFTAYAATLGAGTVANVVAPCNPNTHGFRYVALHDKHHYPQKWVALYSGSGTIMQSVGNNTIVFEVYPKGTTYYTNQSGTSIPAKNDIGLWFVSDSSTTPLPTLNWSFDIEFDDEQT